MWIVHYLLYFEVVPRLPIHSNKIQIKPEQMMAVHSLSKHVAQLNSKMQYKKLSTAESCQQPRLKQTLKIEC